MTDCPCERYRASVTTTRFKGSEMFDYCWKCILKEGEKITRTKSDGKNSVLCKGKQEL